MYCKAVKFKREQVAVLIISLGFLFVCLFVFSGGTGNLVIFWVIISN